MSKNVRVLALSGQTIISICTVLAFVFALFIDFTSSPFGGYADQRFALVTLSGSLIVALTSMLFLQPPANLKSAILHLVPSSLLCFAFLLLAAPFHSKLYAWAEPGMYICFFFSAILVGAWLSWTDASIKFAKFLSAAAAVFCVTYGLASVNVYLFAVNDGVTNLVDYLPWGFVNIRYWSHIATWCLPLLPLAALIEPLNRHRLWRMLLLIGAAIWWWMLFLSAGRGSFLAIVFGVIVVVVLIGRKSFPWVNILLAHFLVGVLLWLLLSVALPSLMAGGVNVSSVKTDAAGRMPLFIEAWRMSIQNFPLGMGPQSWLTHEILTDGYLNSKKFGHPHNMYLMWAAEYGWLLIACLGLVVAQAMRHFLKARLRLAARDSERLLILTAITASVSSALFHAGGSAVFMAPASMLVGLFVLAAFWGLVIPGRDDGIYLIHRSSHRHIRAVIALTLALGLSTTWLLWMKDIWGYYEAMRIDEEHYFETVGEGILPRFWFHGNFPRQSEQ